jgi:SET family sugar efflux transporter-like MFS transporter
VGKQWLILLGMVVVRGLLPARRGQFQHAAADRHPGGPGRGNRVVGALGITYVQDLFPRATGRATALFANTLTTGSLIAGILAGATAQALGYRAALLLCGALSAVGCVLLASARQPRSAADTDLEPWPSPALARQVVSPDG